MIEYIKNWIINISTAVFFIVAIEMVLPNNSIKKYARFVLGLILIVVIINPLIEFVDKGKNIETYLEKTSECFEEKVYENEYDNCKEKNIQGTLKNFKVNVEKACIKKLKEKYPNDNYVVDACVKFDSENNNFLISAINIGIKKSKIDKVKKVDIKTNTSDVKSKKILKDAYSSKIKKYIKEQFKIPEGVITIYEC
ncbi:stage III sporulation protein AF [Haloimpatiens sp. FM7330]|uniref:stage III sporulation protein AF n=1 Tax=Haloimpatiens sp. FM7330 TaxID=3298610 RepID=UPI003628F978